MTSYLRVVGGCVALAALVVLVGCGQQPIATVGQHKITRTDLLERLEQEHGRSALIDMISLKLMEDAFEASGLTVSEEEINERLEQITSQFPSPEAFAQALAAQGQTEADLRERVAQQYKLEKLSTKDVTVTEQELREFFEQYSENFARPATMDYREIVVSTEEEAKKVAEEAAKPDVDFGNLARQYSVQPMSRERGGAIEGIPSQQIYPEAVRQALEGMEAGQVSAPIQGDAQWYVVKLEKVEPAEEPNFDRQREVVEEVYRAQRAKQPQELLAELREKAVVNVMDPRYADINDLFRPQPDLPEFGETNPTQGHVHDENCDH